MKRHKIEFFCDDQYKDCIPEPYASYKHVPKWYADTPMIKRSKCPFKFFENNGIGKNITVKGCPGITDFLTYGYVIPAWTNFFLREVDGGMYINWENPNTVHYQLHEKNEYSGMSDDQLPLYDGFHKINSPWYIKTSPGISCMYLHPYWERENRFTSVSAIIHSDVTPAPIKWFFEWHRKLPTDHMNYDLQTIKRGTPLLYVFPFQRTNFKSQINYVSSKKMHNMDNQAIFRNQDWYDQSIYQRARKSFGRLFS